MRPTDGATYASVRATLAEMTTTRASRIDRAMSFYSPDIVYYDAVAPLRFTGADEVRRSFVRWYNGYVGPIGRETHDLTIVAADDVASATMLHLDSGNAGAGDNARAHLEQFVRALRPAARRSTFIDRFEQRGLRNRPQPPGPTPEFAGSRRQDCTAWPQPYEMFTDRLATATEDDVGELPHPLTTPVPVSPAQG